MARVPLKIQEDLFFLDFVVVQIPHKEDKFPFLTGRPWLCYGMPWQELQLEWSMDHYAIDSLIVLHALPRLVSCFTNPSHFPLTPPRSLLKKNDKVLKS